MNGMRFKAFWLVSMALAGCDRGPAPDTGAPTLAGAWRASLQFSSGAFSSVKGLEFMYVFNLGGTMTESSNYDAAPPVPPAYGTWRMVGKNQYEARYEFYVTMPSPPEGFKAGAGWIPAGRGVFTERIILSADGRTFRSSITYEAFGMQGQPVEGGGVADGHGVRMGSDKPAAEVAEKGDGGST